MDNDVLKSSIKDYIFNTLLSNANTESIDDSNDLVQSGLLDSLKLIQLCSYLTEKFSIEFENEDYEVENFLSIETTVRFVLLKSSSHK
jgi:acyl carrier protein